VVTGASQGIGRACAKLPAMEGVRVAAAARRAELVAELAAEVKDAGGVAITPITCDLYQPEAPKSLVEEATRRLALPGHFMC
jgi:3-oxoacyl-[acyl-carrier protein] reductase